MVRIYVSTIAHDPPEDEAKIDFTKDPEENVREILTNIVKQKGVSNALKLNSLNAFVKLSGKLRLRKSTTLSREEVFCCLRVGLINEAKEIRAATLRVLRYICTDGESFQILIRLGMDHLIARSIDIWLDNEIERIHALRLVRRLLAISSDKFPRSLFGAILSVACDGARERDRMVSVCLATLCEIALTNSALFCEHGGLGVVLKSILDCYQFPRINESLLSVILYLLNWPQTRHYVLQDITLEKLLAPFTDNHYRFNDDGREQDFVDRNEDRFAACKMAVATMMKSWPGIIRMCNPESSGLQSLLAVLYLPHMETQKEVMDILFDVFRLPVPVWTDDFNKALLSIDSSDMRDSWRLNEGFVVQEGKDILPHIAKTRPNLVDNQVALILLTLIGAGLPEALVAIVRTGSDFLLVRATILLSDMLYLVRVLFPLDLNHRVQTLPSLLSLATSFDASPAERNRASIAVCQLKRLHAMRKRRPRPCSFFLSHLMNRTVPTVSDSASTLDAKGDLPSFSGGATPSSEKEGRSGRRSSYLRKRSQCSPIQCITEDPQSKMEYYTNTIRDADHEKIQELIRDSLVTTSKENTTWDWEIIATILKKPDRSLKKLEDPNSHRFVRRLLYYFKPSNNKFSTTELSSELHRKLVVVGLHFTELMATCDMGMELYEVARDFMMDIAKCLNEILSLNKSSADSVFRPSALADSCSQYYFLFIGHFALTPTGDSLLVSLQIYQMLLSIIAQAPSDVYVKVIISSFNYSQAGMAREILSKALTSTIESSRKFATMFLRVLLRAHVSGFNKWGTQLLVTQLADTSMLVATEALSVLSEATEDESCLKIMITLKPQLSHLGYKGAMLFARFLSDAEGFRQLQISGDVDKELDRWHKVCNMQYVRVVEERLNEALTTYEKSYDGSYVRRSHSRMCRKDCFVPVHLYGQLVQHERGFSLLRQQPYIDEYFNTLVCEQTRTEDQVTRVKCALWVVGHIGSSTWGLQLLEEKRIVPQIIKLAEESGIFSLRGTSFYALGLIASTSRGANILAHFGWESTCRNRVDQFSTDRSNCLYTTAFSQSSARIASGTVLFDNDYQIDSTMPDFVSRQESAISTAATSKSPLFFIGSERMSRSNTMTSQDLKVIAPDHHANRSGKDIAMPSTSADAALPSISSDIAAPSLSNETAPEVDNLRRFSFRSRSRGSIGDRVTTLKRESIDLKRQDSGKRNVEDEIEGTSPAKLVSSAGTSPDKVVVNGHLPSTTKMPVMFGLDDLNKVPMSQSVNSDREVIVANSLLVDNHVSPSSIVHSADRSSVTVGFNAYRPPSRSLTETLSNDSGHLISSATLTGKHKDRSDTDATGTSDHSSSCDSGHVASNEADTLPLTPIPSVESINSMTGVIDRPRLGSSQSSTVPSTPAVSSLNLHSHPSDVFRAHANLRRVPSMHRPGSHTALGTMCGHADPVCEKGLASGDYDSKGFAALRELRRQRSSIIDSSEDGNIHVFANEPLHEEHSFNSLTNHPLSSITENAIPNSANSGTKERKTRTRYLSSQADDPLQPVPSDNTPLRTKPVSVAQMGLTGVDGELIQESPSAKYLRQRVSSTTDRDTGLYSVGRQEYIGICLPFDIRMLFQVTEDEDSKSSIELPSEPATSCQCINGSNQTLSGYQSQCASQQQLPQQHVQTAASEGLENHCPDTCIGCVRVRVRTLTVSKSQADDGGLKAVFTVPVSLDELGSASKSPQHLMSAHTTPCHANLPTADKSEEMPVVTEDTPQGRVLVRKDIIRLVVNLASAIGCKSSEQGLLILKQRFPRAFSDACLYSEVCYLLSHYHYRLAARRFIQELFLDSNFISLFDEPREILGIIEPPSSDADSMPTPPNLFELPEPPPS